ncbi:MAG TPA: hypothetical protein VLA39_12710, partial [Marinobacterium sp.]|nr:hypothetical protein [Marinobacterium sp.]
PKGFSGVLSIRVIARDERGAEVETMIVIDISNGAQGTISANEAQGSEQQPLSAEEGDDQLSDKVASDDEDLEMAVFKPGLKEQLQSQSQFVWKAERDELVKKAKKLRS